MPNQKKRTCKRVPVQMAEAVESLILRSELPKRNRKSLDTRGKERAELIKQVLVDMQNDAHVFVDDPRIVKAYLLAVHQELSRLDDRNYQEIQRKFTQIQDLLAGYVVDPSLKNGFKTVACSDSRLQEIDAEYNGDYAELAQTKAAHEQASDWRMKIASGLLRNLKEQLERLERAPENEAVRFQLESEIEKVQREATLDEWPDVIEGGSF